MIIRYLRQRYPKMENTWEIILPVTLFISLFMVVYQPFGLGELQREYKIIFLLGYGLVTFIILILDLFCLPVIFPSFFREENWTVWKEILILLWILFSIGLGNLCYSTWLPEIRFSFTGIVIFQAFTLAVGIIPVTVLTIIKQNYLKRKYREKAEKLTSALKEHQDVSSSQQRVKIASENEKEFVDILPGELLAIRSDGNYITVFYLKNGKTFSILLRNTLTYAVDLLASCPEIYRCHRSWLVNLEKVSRVSGNSQGFRLYIEGMEEAIPVARSNSAELKRLLTQNDY